MHALSARLGLTLSIGALAMSGCASGLGGPRLAPAGYAQAASTGGFPNIGYSDWSEGEAPYRFYPGDEIEVIVPTDPALNRTGTVGPDGRVSLLYLDQPLMFSGRTIAEVQTSLQQAYGRQMRTQPRVTVALKAPAPLTVYVGGEVNQPNEYPITGDANALQAIMKAGGFKPSAKSSKVVVIRRTESGVQSREFDLQNGLRGGSADLAPLKRGDIIFVPRSTAAEIGVWAAQVRDALPIQFGYSLNSY